jgi:hypothetical protein
MGTTLKFLTTGKFRVATRMTSASAPAKLAAVQKLHSSVQCGGRSAGAWLDIKEAR